ncbi:hypothetical protein [Hymenobacter guriensis]|uniref:Uncharacterized protein n=1 Tax=Hymenobacter guriensis TaxID=2793065 RepID=A0ABS0KW97_9BACT|nr:hypothetical protein [Hymenobacter guriensis]MBG8552142.1 hypothetical protein [Hymenobacter guriensis]
MRTFRFPLLSAALLGALLSFSACGSGDPQNSSDARTADLDGNGSADINGSDGVSTDSTGMTAEAGAGTLENQSAGTGGSTGAGNTAADAGASAGSSNSGGSVETTTPASGNR